ncbi:Acid phosphatase 1 [Dichanthelium oligosanthes]|uniref:Acid phosphatase 1 n=1 Tax=Dichanthelium oligosanthes TaxID=888268 RepID=A0A1E5UJX7_9POAL|nr:Acid phosphatase 1 [Dichanthelium oligosanthes]
MRPLLIALALSLAVASAAASASASGARSVLRTVTSVPSAVSSGDDADALFCDSWRLSVETANAGPWRAIPARCTAFVGDYIEGPRYASDSAVAAADSLAFASGALAAAGVDAAKPAWVFDVDETLLSNAPYYAVNGWGSQEFNETSFDEWVDSAKAPALPSSLKLYNELQGLGFHVILLTGRTEFQRNSTEANLLFAGYQSWEKLILRQPSDIGKTAVQYKSERRAAMEAEGFKILGNSGDQWSDLIGSPMATRSFKLPNPMYFIS